MIESFVILNDFDKPHEKNIAFISDMRGYYINQDISKKHPSYLKGERKTREWTALSEFGFDCEIVTVNNKKQIHFVRLDTLKTTYKSNSNNIARDWEGNEEFFIEYPELHG